MPPWLRRTLVAATASGALAAVPMVASAAPADTPGYDCQVAQVSASVLTAQFCVPFGGAPDNGFLITGDFTVNAVVFNGSPGVADCGTVISQAPVSGVLIASSGSVEIIGINCQKVA